MADVTLQIGGYAYTLSCADGEEPALTLLGEMVTARVAKARSMLGGLSENRQLLFAAILLADELNGGGTPAPASTETADAARAVDRASERIERIARTLMDILPDDAS